MTSWSLPRELDQPFPRAVGRAASVTWDLVGLVFSLVFFTAIIMGGAYLFGLRLEVLKTRGVLTEGRVVGLYIGHGRFGPLYTVDYAFASRPSPQARAALNRAAQTVSERDYRLLHPGEAVPVIYDPADPDWAKLDLHDSVRKSDPFADLPAIFVLELVAIGLGFARGPRFGFYGVLAGYIREKRLLRWGRAAPAEIVEKRDVRFPWPGTALVYRFTDADGKVVDGVCNGLPSRVFKIAGAGARLASMTANPTVIYDPRNSARNMLYPAAYVVCLPPPRAN